MAKLPSDPLPALPDPALPDGESIYANSPMRDVCGTRINPDAIAWYKRRGLITDRRCIIRTGAHPELETWLSDVQGFDPRSFVTQPPPEEWPISAICPRVDIPRSGMPYELEPMTYLVDYAAFNRNPRALPDPDTVPDLFEKHFPQDAKLILSFFSNKPLILGLWAQTSFWYQPWLDQFDAIIIPDFFAYSDDPWPQSRLGERMHQIFAEEGSQAGHTVIPSVAWASEESLARQIDLWASSYPKLNTIRLDCLGHNVDKTGWAWRWLFAIEKYCKGLDHIRWMISGMTAGWMIKELNRIFPKRNYVLTTTLSMYVAPQRGGATRERAAQQFSASVRKLQDYRAGRLVADSQPRPEKWPKFADVKKTRQK